MFSYFRTRKRLWIAGTLILLACAYLTVKKRPEAPLGPDAWGREALQGEGKRARDLLNAQSFEVVALYLYAQDYERGIPNPWTRSLLEACTQCVEGPWQGRPHFRARLRALHRIFQSVKEGSLSPQTAAQMTQPAGLAAVLLYHPEVELDPGTPSYEGRVSLQDLEARGLERKYLDALALEYARLSPHVYFSVLLPRGYHQCKAVRAGIEEIGELIYEKDVHLHHQGPYNYLQHTYGYLCNHPHSWIRDKKRIRQHIAKRFSTPDPMHIYLFSCPKWREVRPWKLRMRALSGMGTRAIHATDFHHETLALAELYCNENAIHFLNFAQPLRDGQFEGLVKEFCSELELQGKSRQEYCLDGNSVLTAFGLEDHSGDFKVVAYPRKASEEVRDRVAQLVFNPEHYFYFCGLKCSTLNHLHRVREGEGGKLVCMDLDQGAVEANQLSMRD